MTNARLNLLIQKCQSHPDYERYTELFNGLDPTAPPRIECIHRAASLTQPKTENRKPKAEESVHRAAPAAVEAFVCNRTPKKLGIFSGSFNPLTLAHTKMAEDAVVEYQLDELLLLLAKANVDKGVFGLPLAARLVTLKRYAEFQPKFSVGVSSHGRYIEKVTALKVLSPPETEFHFIVGYDTLVRIFDPKYYTDFHAELQELFIAARFIVANRAEADLEAIASFMAQPELRRYAPYVSSILLSDVHAHISSTEVRCMLAQGEAIEHLVPPSIAALL